MRDELVEQTGDLDVSFVCYVLIVPRGGTRRGTHPVHQLRGRGAGSGGDRVRRVSEIVEVEAVREIVDCCSRASPVAIGGSLAEHVGAFTGEQATVPAEGGEASEVSLQLGNEELTAVELDLLLLHPDSPVEEVDMAALEAEQFAATEAEETREQDQAPVSRRRRIREGPDLFDGRDGPLGDPFDACSFDGARIADDQLVGDGGLEDRAQKPVTHGDGVGREPYGQLRAPLAHGRRPELAER